jgi:hypothetical protein
MASLIYTKIADFKDGAGNIDWKAYRRAEVANGERCSRPECEASFIFSANGKPTLCNPCKEMASERGEIRHDDLVRCPKCGHSWAPDPVDDSVFSDGENSVACEKCDHDFEVTTIISFSFKSPARLA